MTKPLLLVPLVFLWTPPALTAAPPQFESDVQPILKAKCVRCHGTEKTRGGLDLSTRDALFRGGDSGPVVVAHRPEESRLFDLVHKKEMPPGGKDGLTPNELDAIRNWIGAGALSGSPQTASVPRVTQHDVEPMMLLRCAACHGLRRQEGGLDLRTKASMLKGGKSGPAIVVGKPEESLLLKKIHSGAMPPRDQLITAGVKPMGPGEIETLTEWIALGTPEVHVEPDVATSQPDPLVTDEDRRHWAFQPPRAVRIPDLRSPAVRTPLDAFLLEQLSDRGMSFSPEADRLTLLRRACYDLTGLPPTPEEARAFIEDDAPDAYERMIDRLLASPRYGERWGRFWLDLAGYADSEGKRSADPIRPHAWRYRDYVIRAFNSDKPYDRFLLEQLAGDELVDFEKGPITPEVMECLVATGFLRMAPDGTGSDVVNYVPERIEVIADEMQVFGSSILGLTIHCARCHSHKYDPIPQRDYYRLLAVFKGAFDEHDWLKPASVPGQTRSDVPRRDLPHVTPEEKALWVARNAALQGEVEDLKKQTQTDAVKRQIRDLQGAIVPEPGIRALWDRGTPSPTYIYRRGDHLQPARLVGPGVPSVLTDGKTPFRSEAPARAGSTGSRLALARWLVEPDHPLTARVMVNRVWKHHFGVGLVKTISNFGTTGERPSHPELLDWLAREFVRSGWSVKHLHRLIMTSTVYRQVSTITAEHLQLDPDNRLLSRMAMQRRDGESLRDTLLFVAGQLDNAAFGVPDPVDARKDGLVVPRPGERGWRRSIYVRQRRSQIPTILDVFDLPQMNPNCVERVDSTVATQSLHLLNNAHVEELSHRFAERVLGEAGEHAARQVDLFYWLALSRPPTEEERTVAIAALDQLTAAWLERTPEPADARKKALATLAHTLMNSAEFMYVD
jgi:mono/diheme cytochrome c family protein